jgi:predicted Zn-dependent protease
MYEPRNDDEAVRHLLELGYIDPDILGARAAALRRQLEAEFQQALKAYERGDVEQAGRQFEQLIVDDPNWVAPRQLLAEIHYRNGRRDEARLQLDWLTLHGVEHPRLALITGAIALAGRDFDTALGALKYAAHVEPTLPSVHMLLGTISRRLGKLDQAEHAFQTALSRNPTDSQALDGLAAICLQRHDFADAADRALEALDHDMNMFSAHYHLGIALAHLGRPQDAIVALEMSARLNATAAAPYYWLEQIAANHLNDPARASQYRERGRVIIRRRRQQRCHRYPDTTEK